jgi:GNAT superfamily N-acetyltransferase
VTVAIRRGGVRDARQAADVWLRARKTATATIPAPIHGDDDVRAWFASYVVPEHELWVAEAEPGWLVGFVALRDDWLEQLYVDPDHTGRGIGSRPLAVAQRERPGGLRLWTFASNTGAQRFYERHGFVEVRRTDGRDNEERAPDILYAWKSRTDPGLNAA